jgi:indolepyruvate decarboxylase
MSSTTAITAPHRPAVTPGTTTVAGYLLSRLAEAGVISVFGVPGDYNLGLLDAITGRPDMAWVGMATEQGAGYAADSYARLRGLGALVTTFGAGELSAINAIAGACAESAPVVHIVGTPAVAARQGGMTLHHNLPGADFGHFARMAAEVTAAQADLRADVAPGDEIDRVLRVALSTSRPVYLTIPADVPGAPAPAPSDPLWVTGPADQAGLAARTDLAGLAETRRACAAAAPGTPLTQEHLWAGLQDFLLPGDLVVADQGTAFYGAAGLTLPPGATLIGQPLWASVGWSLPAAFGASLAAPDRRAVLVIGDGAFQRTAPELGTMLDQGLAPVVIVLSSGGYAIERVMHNPSAAYHRIPAWDWTTVPAALAGSSSPVAVRAATARELGAALRTASDNAGRPVLIEAVLSETDAPVPRQDQARVLATRNSYTRN